MGVTVSAGPTWSRSREALPVATVRELIDHVVRSGATPDELDRSTPAAAPDFSGDVADPFAEAAVPDPPEGWESWDECQAAHDVEARRGLAGQ